MRATRVNRITPPGDRARYRRRTWGAMFAAFLAGCALLAVTATTGLAKNGTNPGPPWADGEGPVRCARTGHTSFIAELNLDPHTYGTQWEFLYSTAVEGPWKPIPGGSGTITQAEAEALPTQGHVPLKAPLGGLTPEVSYFIMLKAHNQDGGLEEKGTCETEPLRPTPFIGGQGTVGEVTGTAATVQGSVDPNGFETHWRYELATSAEGPWTITSAGVISQAEAEANPLGEALGNGITLPESQLTGLSPSTQYFVRLYAEDEPEPGTIKVGHSEVVAFSTAGAPSDVATFATHGIHGEELRALGTVRPNGNDTHYHFEYVSQDQFAAFGWADASSTPEVDAGAGERREIVVEHFAFPLAIVGADLGTLAPATTYRYRLVASNALSNGPVLGNEQTLTTPPESSASVSESCPNASLRQGSAASLPDCRAYEQVTPQAKDGTFELFEYGLEVDDAGVLVGEDGSHFMVSNPLVHWDSAGGDSPFFFTRRPGKWSLVAGEPQPEGGVFQYSPSLFSPSLERFAFAAQWDTGEGIHSSNVLYELGAPGGPYTVAATVPYAKTGDTGDGWVAASADFSTLVLETQDRTLAGAPTTTISGDDLYEYIHGAFSQVNVGVGSCGAKIAKGYEESQGKSLASRNTVSAEGSRVFFQAVPGSDCGQPAHLYVRENGATTIDIGPYRFAGANADGSSVLVSSPGGQYSVYNTETRVMTPAFTATVSSGRLSENFTSFYFTTPAHLTSETPDEAGGYLYEYSIVTKTLRFIGQVSANNLQLSPDGRYLYFEGGVAGLPGGSGTIAGQDVQVYRYDSREQTVECVSCASPFDASPKLAGHLAGFGEESGTLATQPGMPQLVSSSADGRFAFFDTPAALVPEDVNGEVPPGEHQDALGVMYSSSSDVYEWRADSVDGCAHAQGCLALITHGVDGYLNLLLGTTASGGDVFIGTDSRLAPTDIDGAADVYDVRIDGGFPQSTFPVECEASTCSTPPAAPNDPTPSSLTFSGAGNLAPAVSPTPGTGAKQKQLVAKSRKARKKRKRKPKTQAKKSDQRRGR